MDFIIICLIKQKIRSQLGTLFYNIVFNFTQKRKTRDKAQDKVLRRQHP